MYKKKWVVKKLVSTFFNEDRIILLCNYIGGNLVVDKKRLTLSYGLDCFFVKGSLVSKFLDIYYKDMLIIDKLGGNLFLIFVEQAKYTEMEDKLKKDSGLVPIYVFKNSYCFSFYENLKSCFVMDEIRLKGSFVKFGFSRQLFFHNRMFSLMTMMIKLGKKNGYINADK
jgi:hypothetical protein